MLTTVVDPYLESALDALTGTVGGHVTVQPLRSDDTYSGTLVNRVVDGVSVRAITVDVVTYVGDGRSYVVRHVIRWDAIESLSYTAPKDTSS